MRWPWSKPDDDYVDVHEPHRKREIEEAAHRQGIEYDSAVLGVNGRRLRLVPPRWKWIREDR